MPIRWHIDGKPVHLHDGWEASITAAGGYEQLTATADREDVRHAHQGSAISAVTEADQRIWFGRLDATPAVSRLPEASLTATGPVSRLRRMRAGWLAQSRDYGKWKPQDSEPYSYSATGRIQVDGQGGRLAWTMSNGTDIKSGNSHGFVAWFPGEAVSRIAFDWTALAASPDLTMHVGYAPGPSGTKVQSGADISLNATSGSVDRALSTGDDDMAYISISWDSANTTTTTHYRARITNLRVNGRSSGDEVAPGDIIQDMASAVGLKTGGVETSGQNALPFYWESGSWGDAVSDLAALDDWPWLVTERGMKYGPWDDTWRLYFSQENEDLDFPPIYNRVRVFYTSLAGAPRSIRVEASPDPLAKFDVDNEYQYDLGESYNSDDIPTAVANALLEEVSRQRVVGTVDVLHGRVQGRVWTPHRRFSVFNEDHYTIAPGTRALLDPYPELGPQRIIGVRLRRDGVTAEFGDSAEAAASRVLARVSLQRSRRRPKYKH